MIVGQMQAVENNCHDEQDVNEIHRENKGIVKLTLVVGVINNS